MMKLTDRKHLHRRDAGLIVGEYLGEVGLNEGNWGLQRGDVGENDGDVGECRGLTRRGKVETRGCRGISG